MRFVVLHRKHPKIVSTKITSVQTLTHQMSEILTKTLAKNIILKAKEESKLTFEEMATKLQQNKVWLTSAIYGEQPFDEELAVQTLELVGLKQSPQFRQLVEVMTQIPEIRGLNHEKYASDPLVSRFYEILRVYSPTFRALITEMCGNGIVSAIDCKLDCNQYLDENQSQRVVIQIDGKFLNYKK